MYFNNEELKERIVKFALLQYKKHYLHGAKGPNEFDCAGLVWFIYNTLLGVDVFYKGYGKSTTTKIMTSKVGELILNNKEIDFMKKGDIILIHRQSLNDNMPKEDNKYPDHCGIYIGDKKLIHATKATDNVTIDNLEESNYLKEKIVGIKRILK